ncbi:MAG: cbb3-type cytochrome oxidase assembly protein CcoS [Saprospiraceae bacterium]|jgi:cbb3-type cytochrome oxidase maturation protein|nr:cbb3-type cytochrome oxidase assembly protein CcoS [Saprospiraceae bacterium]MBK8735102.1 cbb3-type cytochrome oxidase assembly protein CcoS [Saprospiraceae bacterium]MBK9994732.1 cbb3-type cytochrome oxidase assembly protein CcoS [Saprospiraceae bacterium]HUN17469.1 cbb3-type cytochrome oxidase assembly protein CcoS [Saprospiraceae bacterium]
MSVIIILLCVSFLISLGFLFSFFWSVKDGQYDDSVSPANKILFDTKNIKNVKK